MRALSSRPFCSCDSRWVSLRYLSAAARYTAQRPCPHRIRVITHENEDIYGRSTQNAKLFQSVISPKAAVNLNLSHKAQICDSIDLFRRDLDPSALRWEVWFCKTI